MEDYLMSLNLYRYGETDQHWRKEKEFDFENEYIKLERIDSSNKSGGHEVIRGKQWSIIVILKKDFTHLDGWMELKKFLGNDLRVTMVEKGELKGCYGIRFYRMSRNPTNDFIKETLNYIFT